MHYLVLIYMIWKIVCTYLLAIQLLDVINHLGPIIDAVQK